MHFYALQVKAMQGDQVIKLQGSVLQIRCSHLQCRVGARGWLLMPFTKQYRIMTPTAQVTLS